MWKKTLFAAAVTGFALSSRAADPEPPPTTTAPAAPKDGQPVKLDTIVVEGARTDESFKAEDQVSGKLPLTIRETPQSVSVITREALDDRQVFNLQQALELSAGVTQYSGTGPFAGQPSFGFNQTTIRGMPIDDQYDFRDDGFISGSYFAVPDLAIYDRIEVVKGANSVLYGRGSVGGLVNRIRKKPLARSRTELELSAGSFDTYRADLDMTGPMFDTKAVRGRLVAVYEDSGSFVRGVGTERTVIAPSVEVELASSTRLLLQALRQQEDVIPNTGMPLRADGANFEAPDISRRQYNGVVTRNPYQWTIESVTAQLEQDIGDRWLAALRLSTSNTDTPIRTDAYVYGFTEGDDPETPAVERRGDTVIMGNDFAIDRDIFSAEVQLNGRVDIAGREAKVGFGADFNDNQYSRRGMYTDVATVGNLYDGDFARPDPALLPGFATSGKPSSEGVFAQIQIPVTDRLKALLGARYDKVHLDTIPYHGTGTATPEREKETVDDVTGRIGLTFELNGNISLYSVYAQSFSPELFATDQDGELLKPEEGELFEAGAKTEWFDRRLGLTAAVYRVDRDNIPVSVDDNPTDEIPPYSVASGLQRSEGFEIEANGRPLPGWDISLAFNTVDSEFKDRDDPFYGNQPGGTADRQIGLYSAYELQAGPAKGLGFGATYYDIDDRGVSAFQLGKIPGYERLDLHAFYKGFRNVEINLLIRNLTDEKYIEGADRSNAIAFFGSPTAALLSVKYTLADR